MYITKQQEREALEKIEKILEPFDENTYLGTALKFETVYGESPVNDARRNCDEDACLSMADRLTSARKRIDELTGELIMVRERATARIRELEEENARLEASTTQALECANSRIKELERNLYESIDTTKRLEEERDAINDSYTQIRSECEGLEHIAKQFESENIRLKARIYDLVIAKEVH